MAAGDADTTVISAAMIYKLLKQLFCDAGCFLNNLTQFVYESVFQFVYESIFQSVPHFSHAKIKLVKTQCFLIATMNINYYYSWTGLTSMGSVFLATLIIHSFSFFKFKTKICTTDSV